MSRLGSSAEAESAATLTMADDRNLISHTYDETLAAAIFLRGSSHAMLIQIWITPMRAKMQSEPG